MQQEKKINNEQLLLRPSRAFELADVGKSLGYELIASGEWPSIRLNPRTIRIPLAGLKAWIERKLAESQAQSHNAPTNSIMR